MPHIRSTSSLPGIPKPSLDDEKPPLDSDGGRRQDPGLPRRGRPPEIAIPRPDLEIEAVTSDEAAAIRLEDGSETARSAPSMLSEAEVLAAASQRAEPAIRALLFVGCGTLLLILGSQLASFAVTLRSLPLAAQIGGGIIAVGLSILVAYGMFLLERFKLAWACIRSA